MLGSRTGPAPGEIYSTMRPRTKAHAYTDLLLAPTGEAVLIGEPEEWIDRVGHENLASCSSDAREIIAALGGLEVLTDEDAQSVVAALGYRADEAMPLLCAFLAFTPYIGTVEPGQGFEAAAKVDFKSPGSSERAFASTAEQDGDAYFTVVTSVLAVLRIICCTAPSGSPLTKVILSSPHAAQCLRRCVGLAGRYMPRVREPELTAALLAREILCALCTASDSALAFVEAADHEGRSAREVIEAVNVGSHWRLPPASGAATAGTPNTPVAAAFSAVSADAARDGAIEQRALADMCALVEGYVDEAARDAARLRFLDSEPLLAPGAPVVLQGLQGRADLNGKPGTIAGERPQREDGTVRYPVAVEGESKPIAVQPINLRLRAPVATHLGADEAGTDGLAEKSCIVAAEDVTR